MNLWAREHEDALYTLLSYTYIRGGICRISADVYRYSGGKSELLNSPSSREKLTLYTGGQLVDNDGHIVLGWLKKSRNALDIDMLANMGFNVCSYVILLDVFNGGTVSAHRYDRTLGDYLLRLWRQTNWSEPLSLDSSPTRVVRIRRDDVLAIIGMEEQTRELLARILGYQGE